MTSILKKWCYLLSIKNITFDVHKINQGDCILIDFRHKTQMYLVTYGCVKLNKTFANTNKLILGIFMEDELININDIRKNKENYYYSLEGLSATLIISCNYKKILQQSPQYLAIYYELLLAQQKYIHKTNDITEILSHRDKKSRLVNLLLVLCKQFGIITKFGIIINLNVTHNALGTIICSSRTTITNTLNSLQKYQLLSIYNNKLIIHDPISLSLHHKTSLHTRAL